MSFTAATPGAADVVVGAADAELCCAAVDPVGDPQPAVSVIAAKAVSASRHAFLVIANPFVDTNAAARCLADSWRCIPGSQQPQFGGLQTLAYGQTRSIGAITCSSEPSGVTCTDSGTGHFFRVSRDSYELG